MNQHNIEVGTHTIKLDVIEVDGNKYYKPRDLLLGFGYDNRSAKFYTNNWINRTRRDEGESYITKPGKHGYSLMSGIQLVRFAWHVSGELGNAVFNSFQVEPIVTKPDNSKFIGLVHSHLEIPNALPHIRQLFGYTEIDLLSFVNQYISAMNTANSDYTSKLRLAKSLNSFIQSKYSNLPATEMYMARQCEVSSKVVQEYISKIGSEEIVRLQNQVTTLTEAMKIRGIDDLIKSGIVSTTVER